MTETASTAVSSNHHKFYVPTHAQDALNDRSRTSPIHTVLGASVTALHRNDLVLRQEVPFERWFLNFGLNGPIKETKVEIKARLYAILATLEGTVRFVAESVLLIYRTAISKNDQLAEKHREVLQAQFKGLHKSFLAILAPNTVSDNIKATSATEEPPIGCKLQDFKWGTIYSGKCTIPLFALEASRYPWKV